MLNTEWLSDRNLRSALFQVEPSIARLTISNISSLHVPPPSLLSLSISETPLRRNLRHRDRNMYRCRAGETMIDESVSDIHVKRMMMSASIGR